MADTDSGVVVMIVYGVVVAVLSGRAVVVVWCGSGVVCRWLWHW